MQKFDEFVSIIEKLLSPDGCPWDREQSLQSIRPYLIEELYEIVEAIDLDDNIQISEEIGDVFFHLVFLCKLAERDQRFTLNDTLKTITEKLIRRHPHVFGEKKVESMEKLYDQWEEIKKEEKGKSSRKSMLDDIPKELPALAKAHKMIGKFNKIEFPWDCPEYRANANIETEEELGNALLALVNQANSKGLNAKHALLKKLTHLEHQFREWEKDKSRR